MLGFAILFQLSIFGSIFFPRNKAKSVRLINTAKDINQSIAGLKRALEAQAVKSLNLARIQIGSLRLGQLTCVDLFGTFQLLLHFCRHQRKGLVQEAPERCKLLQIRISLQNVLDSFHKRGLVNSSWCV